MVLPDASGAVVAQHVHSASGSDTFLITVTGWNQEAFASRIQFGLYQNTAMPNIGSILKAEIARLARKEVKAEITALHKSSSRYRSEIAALKRRLDALERQARRAGQAAASPAERQNGDPSVRRRFRVGGLASHRRKLGLSAEDYGLLVGVSGQSIYKWERGDIRPRAKQLEALAAVRGIGKREALARLEELEAASKKTVRKAA